MISPTSVARRVAALGALVLALPLGAVVVAPPAHATNFGSICDTGSTTACVSVANNIYHVINWIGDEDINGMQSSHGWARDNQYNPTDLVAYTDGSDSYPDVLVQDEPYGVNGWYARVDCPTNNTGTGGSHPNRWCRGQTLKYNASYATYFSAEANRRATACHEIGHTVGLRHATDTTSCMNNVGSYPETLNAHDRAHINGHY